MNNPYKALSILTSIAPLIEDQYIYVSILQNISSIKVYIGKYEEALEHSLQSIKLLKDLEKNINTITTQVIAYRNIAIICEKLKQFNKANKFDGKARELAMEKLGPSNILTMTLEKFKINHCFTPSKEQSQSKASYIKNEPPDFCLGSVRFLTGDRLQPMSNTKSSWRPKPGSIFYNERRSSRGSFLVTNTQSSSPIIENDKFLQKLRQKPLGSLQEVNEDISSKASFQAKVFKKIKIIPLKQLEAIKNRIKASIIIQKHVRGYFARKKYREILEKIREKLKKNKKTSHHMKKIKKKVHQHVIYLDDYSLLEDSNQKDKNPEEDKIEILDSNDIINKENHREDLKEKPYKNEIINLDMKNEEKSMLEEEKLKPVLNKNEDTMKNSYKNEGLFFINSDSIENIKKNNLENIEEVISDFDNNNEEEVSNNSNNKDQISNKIDEKALKIIVIEKNEEESIGKMHKCNGGQLKIYSNGENELIINTAEINKGENSSVTNQKKKNGLSSSIEEDEEWIINKIDKPEQNISYTNGNKEDFSVEFEIKNKDSIDIYEMQSINNISGNEKESINKNGNIEEGIKIITEINGGIINIIDTKNNQFINNANEEENEITINNDINAEEINKLFEKNDDSCKEEIKISVDQAEEDLQEKIKIKEIDSMIDPHKRIMQQSENLEINNTLIVENKEYSRNLSECEPEGVDTDNENLNMNLNPEPLNLELKEEDKINEESTLPLISKEKNQRQYSSHEKKAAIYIQSYFRRHLKQYLNQLDYSKSLNSILTIQKYYRGYKQHIHYKKLKNSVVTIQKNYRMYSVRILFKSIKDAVIFIQGSYRKYLKRKSEKTIL